MSDFRSAGGRPETLPVERGRTGRPDRSLFREERDAWRQHYRKYFKHAARALGLGFVVGFLYFLLWPDQEQKALEFVINALKDIRLEGSPLVLAMTLFYHNARASVLAVAAGAVPFLFLPILDPLLNGAVLGLLVSVTKHQGPRRPPDRPDQDPAARRLRAHRRLLRDEPRAVSLGRHGEKAAAAWREKKARRPAASRPAQEPLRGTRWRSRRSARTGRRPETESLARNVVRSFVLVVLPLLLVAALIEGFITPHCC